MSYAVPGSLARVPHLVGINHVAVEVGDIGEALDFYGRIFELALRGRSAGMAFIDMGDQFLALSTGRTQPPDQARHIGLVVDDREATLAAAQEAGAEMIGDNDFRDPWGNHFQIVAYEAVQFERSPGVKRKLGIEELGKSEAAQREIAERGLA